MKDDQIAYNTLKVYIGYDPRENIAWEVCRFSIQRHLQNEVPIYPLKQPELRALGLYTRPVDTKASTEFSLTRFLTPYLAAYEGWSLFVDCDFLFTTDIMTMMSHLDPKKALYVVKHDYTPSRTVKMDGKAQTVYPRKNWSSFMVFNGAHPAVKRLTPDVVNTATPAFLHRMQWVKDEDIGALDISWNFLVGEYDMPETVPCALHYTNGGPWFDGVTSPYDALWLAERDLFLAEQRL